MKRAPVFAPQRVKPIRLIRPQRQGKPLLHLMERETEMVRARSPLHFTRLRADFRQTAIRSQTTGLYTGITGVNPTVREAARGMGLTDWQLLWHVELPLGLGVILAGAIPASLMALAADFLLGWTGRYLVPSAN